MIKNTSVLSLHSKENKGNSESLFLKEGKNEVKYLNCYINRKLNLVNWVV